MAQLNTHERTIIEWVLKYQNSPAGAYEKPLDGKSAEELSKIYSRFGYASQIKFLEDLRDAPFSTLLRGMLAINN
jgi:hypothetical protein